jgi:hypothetical protein
LTRPAPAPAKKRKRGEEERGAFIRKHLRRLWRKMAWKTVEDWRDAPPTFDSDEWHRHQQRTAGCVHDDECRLHAGADRLSPTRDALLDPRHG